MYLLFLDESGTHGASPVFVLGGIAVHENDVWSLTRRIETTLHRHLTPLGLNAFDFELHASEMKTPTNKRPPSPWTQVPLAKRLSIITAVYRAIWSYTPQDPKFPVVLFGAVVDARRPDREKHAYELVLNKFDDMLAEVHTATGDRQRGVVIHDERVVEQSVQAWTNQWMEAAGAVGKLYNIVVVPLFANSKTSRLLQGADFVSYALWRYYGLAQADERWAKGLWPLFHSDGTHMHGLIHVSRAFAKGTCKCPPCSSRLITP